MPLVTDLLPKEFTFMQSDYSIRIDQEWSIDGCSRALDTSAFSPCHMNHSTRCRNVVRSTSRRKRKVSFFTDSDIQVMLCAHASVLLPCDCFVRCPQGEWCV